MHEGKHPSYPWGGSRCKDKLRSPCTCWCAEGPNVRGFKDLHDMTQGNQKQHNAVHLKFAESRDLLPRLCHSSRPRGGIGHLLKPARLPWRASILCGGALLALLLLQPHLLVVCLHATSQVSAAPMSASPVCPNSLPNTSTIFNCMQLYRSP